MSFIICLDLSPYISFLYKSKISYLCKSDLKFKRIFHNCTFSESNQHHIKRKYIFHANYLF